MQIQRQFDFYLSSEINDLVNTPIHQETYLSHLFVDVQVEIRILRTYETIIDFTLLGTPYTFTVTKWKTRGLAQLLSLFHSMLCAPYNDQVTYGATNDQGFPVINFDQKTAVVRQASLDVFSCVNQILAKHGRSVLDYAVYRLENVPTTDDYPTYITTIACHCIAQSHFLAPSLVWEKVLFVPQVLEVQPEGLVPQSEGIEVQPEGLETQPEGLVLQELL